MKTHRSRPNILTFKELQWLVRSMPGKYSRALTAKAHPRSSSRRLGFHYNSLAHAVKTISLSEFGKQTSICGIRRTMLLRDLACGRPWPLVEKEYGAQMVKTACADLVRQCCPKILFDNLGR